MIRLKVRSINRSEEKGTVKLPVNAIRINETGLENDAHAGHWHRQVSLLGVESIRKAEHQNNRNYVYGDFGENVTTEGFELYKANILDRFQAQEVVLEVTQIGKKCHKGCQIMKTSGSCIMPVEGIFCRVVQPGMLRVDEVFTYVPKVIKAAVITVSDRAYKGIYSDKSGPLASFLLADFFRNINRGVETEHILIPDEKSFLENAILNCVKNGMDIIITTGGTGIGSRDITPDVIRSLIDKEIPGIIELIRYKYGAVNPKALLSRSIAGVIHKSLIYAIPGSTTGVKEYLAEITPTLEHSLRMLNDLDVH